MIRPCQKGPCLGKYNDIDIHQHRDVDTIGYLLFDRNCVSNLSACEY